FRLMTMLVARGCHVVCSSWSYRSRCPRSLHSFPTRRSSDLQAGDLAHQLLRPQPHLHLLRHRQLRRRALRRGGVPERRGGAPDRSEEHTSELQSRENLVCRLLLEKKTKSGERENPGEEVDFT